MTNNTSPNNDNDENTDTSSNDKAKFYKRDL